MTLGPTLTTARLILRPPQQEDFDGFAQFASEEETMRFLGGVQPPDAAWRAVAIFAGHWALLGYGMFSVLRRDTGEWIGRVGPWRPGGEKGQWPGAEVGWGLKRAATRQGYAQEAASAAIDWAFDQLGWTDVVHCIETPNAPSAVVAQRLGSTLLRADVPLPPPFNDKLVDVYGQSRAQWRARTSA